MNNNGKININNLLSSRRFKYGSVAIAFTVVFCAVIILLNAIFTVVSDNNGGFFIDLTEEHIYDLSETTGSVLSGLNRKVEIIFCMTEDKIDDNSVMLYIKRLADKYKAANEKIDVIFRDCVSDPVYFNQFKRSSTDKISQFSVIINCPENKRYIVYHAQKFYKYSSETGAIFAYDGENKLTSAIMQTAVNQMQKAAFITGHGETRHSSLEALLREQGYEVNDIDLKNISKEELDSYNLLVISNPQYDYTGIAAANEGRVNEIGLLNNYLTNTLGNLMVFINPETPALTELSSFLADDWGVKYTTGDIAAEASGMALEPYGRYFIGTPDSTGAGSAIHNSITTSGVNATVFANVTPLEILFAEKNTKTVSPVYVTSEQSVRYRNGEPEAVSHMPVMTLSTYSKYIDNEEYISNVLVCGSSVYMNFIGDQSYANADVLKSAFALMGNESVVTGISYKVVEDTALTVTQEDFKNYAVMLSTIVPVIIALIGIYVYIKRKKA